MEKSWVSFGYYKYTRNLEEVHPNVKAFMAKHGVELNDDVFNSVVWTESVFSKGKKFLLVTKDFIFDTSNGKFEQISVETITNIKSDLGFKITTSDGKKITPFCLGAFPPKFGVLIHHDITIKSKTKELFNHEERQSDMNKCSKCGTEVPKDNAFCGKCGGSVVSVGVQDQEGDDTIDEKLAKSKQKSGCGTCAVMMGGIILLFIVIAIFSSQSTSDWNEGFDNSWVGNYVSKPNADYIVGFTVRGDGTYILTYGSPNTTTYSGKYNKGFNQGVTNSPLNYTVTGIRVLRSDNESIALSVDWILPAGKDTERYELRRR